MSKKYPSKYSPGKYVSEMQYIIEMVCERNAAQTQRELPIKFWELPQWASFYKSQLRKCQALLKKYSSEAILKTLNDYRCNKAYSLFYWGLEKVIIEYQTEIDRPKIKNEVVEIGGDSFKRPEPKTLLDKLDE